METNVVEQIVAPIIQTATAKHGWLTAILVWVGVLRLTFKPLMSLIHSLVAATPGQGDNLALAKVEANWFFKAFCYVLDWTASIKVGTQSPKK